MTKVTGIGGIFFKCKDPGKMQEWYSKNLGIVSSKWGTKFEWRELDNPDKKGYTVWSPFEEKTTYFEPSGKEFMINYHVDDIHAMVDQLRKNGIVILDEIEEYEYGKFVHIMDPEGRKIELFEPAD